MQLHDFEIEQINRTTTKVKIDGKELQGVIYVDYENRVGDAPEITIRLVPGTLNLKDKKADNVTTTITTPCGRVSGLIAERNMYKELKEEI